MVAYSGDVRDAAGWPERHDAVCHLAGITKPDGGAVPWEMFDVNVSGTLAVLEYCARVGARCVVASSSAVYKPVAKHESLGEAAEINPVLLYGASKALAERACAHSAVTAGTSVSALRVFNLYGVGQHPSFIVPEMMAALMRRERVEVREPLRVRDFVNVQDVARAFVMALATQLPGYIAINIGTGVGTSLASLALSIADVVGAQPALVGDTGGAAEDGVVAETGLAARLLGWRAETGLEAGLLEMAGAARG